MHPSHQDQITRLNKVEGQIKGIKRMVEGRRYCIDILSQIKAAKSALEQVEMKIMENHIQHCLKEAAESQDPVIIKDKIEEVMKIVGRK